MKLPKHFLGSSPVLFGDSHCPACLAQVKLLMDSVGQGGVVYYDLSRFDAPDFIADRNGSVSMPTWVFPDGTIHRGVIRKNLKSLVKNNRNSRFGKCDSGDPDIPQLDSLAKCGKNFPGGGGMNIPNSFMNTIKDKWGDDYLNAGIGGVRSLPPGQAGIDKYFSNNNLNDIRMAEPGGQLETMFSLNRRYNQVNNDIGTCTYGLVYDSKNPQIVGFGRAKKSQFGKYLYKQMGNAYENAPLVRKDTVRDLYGGAIQNNLAVPRSVQNKNIFIGQVNDYNPVNEFGRKNREGKVIHLTKKNKIKVKKS
jgi:hypothetical protein